ncbi:hypothetical protein LTS15_010355 [Exophiala xenobiotica]|nr:hypothetical protein LTS15_010355 [Exophiala xenobiotica]
MSLATIDNYQYERLLEPRDGEIGQFRVLNLLRGTGEAEIHVTISTHALGYPIRVEARNRIVELDWLALSYVCGDHSDDESIVVERGGTGGVASSGRPVGRLNITRNLATALRQLRFADKDRMLWVDAICIDQGTDEVALHERAWQVRQMHRIYIHATGVLIWLGTAVDDSGIALEYLSELGSPITVDWATLETKTPDGKETEAMRLWRECPANGKIVTSVLALLARPWFHRVWTIQEAIMGQESWSQVVCGSDRMPFAWFRRAIHCLTNLGLDSTDAEFVQRQELIGRAASICGRWFLDEPNIMARVRPRLCEDPRDKVYASIGLMRKFNEDGMAKNIKIDYSASYTVEEVYIDFFRRYSERFGGSLYLLVGAGLCQGSTMRPTWVPDWREKLTKTEVTMECATSHLTGGEAVYLGGGVLRVHTRMAFKIHHAHQLNHSNTESADRSPIPELADLVSKWLGKTNATVEFDRFARTISHFVKGRELQMTQIQSHLKAIQLLAWGIYDRGIKLKLRGDISPPQLQDTLPEKLGIQYEEGVDYPSAANELISALGYQRRTGLPFIFSDDGFIGIGPLGAQQGDEAHVILGCRAPMVLRPTKEGQYQVVGAACVYGLNWGEALLGPLPQDYVVMPTRSWREFQGYETSYVNQKTGESTMWDPRIAWEELEAHPPMISFYPVPAPPGEPFRVRPDSAYLQRHNIDLQQIDLV